MLYVALTVDTEGDNYWAGTEAVRFENIARLPEFQEFCEGLGLKPTYLVAYEVVANEEAREVVRLLGRAAGCEVGGHLHAWLTPPQYPELEAGGALAYLHEYPEEVRGAKLQSMHEALIEGVGVEPRSYRGGRWSLDEFTVGWLEEHGYLVDSTVTPYWSWWNARGAVKRGINYCWAPDQPYRISKGDICRPAEGARLLEVPVSLRLKRLISPGLYKRLGRMTAGMPVVWAISARLLRPFVGPIRPNPARVGLRDLLTVAHKVAAEGGGVVNIVVHSSELMAGGAPWVQSKEQERRVWQRLEHFVKALDGLSPWRAVTLTEIEGLGIW